MKESKTNSRPKNKLGYIDPTVAGIDIGSKLIHVSIPNKDGGVNVIEYETTTPDLLKIAKDLKKAGVTKGVMEATGVYWIPLFETLESKEFSIQPILVDAKSVKNVPGRKTDVIDCQWIQTLYSNGLLRAAFRPARDRLPLREYVRARNSLIRDRQKVLNKIEKALQLMNVKLSTAVADIAGLSGMAIIRAIVAGKTDPKHLASLRHKSCKKQPKVFINALTGHYRPHLVFILKLELDQYDYLYEQLNQLDEQILNELEKLPTVMDEPLPLRDKDKGDDGRYKTARKPKKNQCTFDIRTKLWEKSGVDLGSIVGISDLSSLTIFAELGGTDMRSWASEKEFSSWLRLCPGNNISGGKRRKCKHRASVNAVSQTLRMSAVSCKNSKSGIGSFIRRICGRTDKPKGIKAGAHRLAIILYQMCKYGATYVEKGEARRNREHDKRIRKSLEKRAKELGLKLVLAE
ncbi:MAG: IS110 family transposase [Bacteroidota bacterium]|nr:IS110 family transposase [Bacteroidota bacterium]